MTNFHKNIINPFLESSTFLIMTFPEIVESKDLLWGRTCAVDNVRARRKGMVGKLYEIQISPERGLCNSLKFPSYFGMEYVRPWNMGKKLLEFCDFRKAKNRPKNVSKWHFFPILGTLKTEGGECSWRRLWATRIPAKKLSPTLLKDFWCFSGPGVGGSAVWGAPHHRALVALGRS